MKIVILFLFSALMGYAQPSVLGRWTTIDDATGAVKAVVEIQARNGRLYGMVLTILDVTNPDPICDKCPVEDERHGKKIVGMEIIKDMKPVDGAYSEGTILDPEDGKIYRSKLWIEGKDLLVRGYWGTFYRTQTWRKST